MRASIPINPQLIQQVTLYIEESNDLIKSSYYRKCISTLDGFYRKLLPIDSSNLLRAQVLRRLCYCILKVLKIKINKSEYKTKRLLFILWKRLTLFIRDLHDIIQGMKKCKKRIFYIKEIATYIITALHYKAIFYGAQSLQGKGLVALFHKIDKSLYRFPLVDGLQGLGGLHYQLFGCVCYQLQHFTEAQNYFLQSFDYSCKVLNQIYVQTQFQSSAKMREALQPIVKKIILNLFMMALNYEQLSNFQKYYESVRLLEWFDQNFESTESMAKDYLIPVFDLEQFKIIYQEELEITKILRLVFTFQKDELQEDLINYDQMLYEFDQYDKINQHYYFARSTSPEIMDNDSQLKQFIVDSESTATIKNSKQKKKIKKLQTEMPTQTSEFQDYSTTFLQSYREIPKSKPKTKLAQDQTLNLFYSRIIESSCNMGEVENYNQPEVGIQQFYRKEMSNRKSNLQFRKKFGCLQNLFSYTPNLSLKKYIKRSNQKLQCNQKVIESQVMMNSQKDKSTYFATMTPKPKMQVDSQTEISNTVRKLTLNPGNEEEKLKQIAEQSKDIIKQFMAEKEALLDKKQKPINHNIKNYVNSSSLLNQLLQTNYGLAHTTYNMSASKKKESIKSLEVSSRKSIVGKRLQTTMIPGSKKQDSLLTIDY